MNHQETYDPELMPSWPVRAGFFVFCAATAFVILGLTSYTYQLDDIKIFGLYAGGGLCLLVWAALWTFRHVPSPPRLIWIPYVAYLGVCLLSTLFAQDFARWIGWQYVPYYLSTFGFVLLGSAVVQTKHMVEWSLKFWVLIALVTTGFGLIHYAGHLETLYNALYNPMAPPTESNLHNLIYTFKESRSMLSTVLNVQFFGNFLLMLLPAVAACGIVVYQNFKRRLGEGDTGFRVALSLAWLVGSGLAVVLALACIFTTFSKSSIFALPMIVLLFLGGVYFFASMRRIPYLWLMATLGAVMAATLLYFTIGDLRNELKNLDESLAPRRIIFGGALGIFQDNPLLGGGPGSFRLLFPEYRSPDYHLSRISNLTLYAHNWILDLLAETGILGAAAYLAFLGGLFYLGYRSLRRCPDMVIRVAVIGGLVGILSILAGALVTPMTRWPVGTASLHAMIGTALGIILMAQREPDTTTAARRRQTAPPPIIWDRTQTLRGVLLAAAVLYFPLVTWWSGQNFEAAMEHGEGWKLSELPPSYFGPSGIADDPRVVAMLEQAEGHLDRSLELDPTRLTTYYRLAHVHNRLGNQQDALQAYIDLREYGPDYSEVHYNLGVIYYNLGTEASDRRNTLLSQGREEEAQAARGKALEYFRESARYFDRAAELNNKITVHFFEGFAHQHIADRLPPGSEEAKEHYKRAGQIFARVATLPLSKVLQQEGQLTQEEEQRFQALREAPRLLEKAGEYELAAKASELYLERNPTSLKGLRDAVEAYKKADKPEEALRLLEENISRNPLNPESLFMKMDVLANMGREQDALEQGKYLLALDEELGAQGSPFLGEKMEEQIRQRMENLAATSG